MANAFLKLADIKGDTKDARHRNQIALESVAFGSAGGQQGGQGSGHATAEPESPLHVTKFLDRSSAKLQRACVNGTHFPNAVITLHSASGSAFVYLLGDVLIGSYSISGVRESAMEEFTLEYATFSRMSEAEFKLLTTLAGSTIVKRAYEKIQPYL